MIYSKTMLVAALAGVGGLATLSQVTIAQNASLASREAAGRGAHAWADNCSSCHNFRSLLEKSDREWEIAATHMRVRANLPGDVVRDIIFFLQSSNEIVTSEDGDEHSQMGAAGSSGHGHDEMGAGHEKMGHGHEGMGQEHGEMGAEDSEQHLAGNAERGAIVFNQTCVACHGPDGRGAIEGVPNLAEHLDGPDDHLLINIMEGVQTARQPIHMPPKGGNPDLREQDVADVIAYMRKHFSAGAEAHKD